jgi:DNA-binding response OmpR family regulator
MKMLNIGWWSIGDNLGTLHSWVAVNKSDSREEKIMAYTSPLNLSGETWVMPNQANPTDRAVNVRPELFAIALTEIGGIPAAFPDRSVPGALREVFESDGLQVVITFAEMTDPNPRFRSKSVSTAMQALVLPFSWEELVARVTSLVHRKTANLGNMARFGNVCIDFSSMEVSRSSGEQIPMTAQEFKALRFFVLNPGRAISRGELLNQAWGYDNYPCSRTVDSHVLKLRQKLEVEPSHPKHFLTVRSVGYKFLP